MKHDIDVIINIAIKLNNVTDKIEGFEYDRDYCTDLATVEIAHLQLEKLYQAKNEILAVAERCDAKQEIITEAINQGASPRHF